jgi:CRISPR-associated protein Cmr1
LSLSVSPPTGEVLRNARRKSAIEVKLSLITPMFGGSADAGQVDPHRPVTAKSIRGHLRFWWRACRAGQFRSVDDMFRREAEIWGAAAEFNNKGGLEQGPGAVDLEVEVTNAGQRVNAAELIPKASRESGPQEGVFMFPFQEQKRDNRPAADALRDVSFTLRLFLKSEGFKEDVRDALIAWILFGGVGARTRRGCGALKLEGGLEDYPSDVNALRDWAGRLPTPPPEPWITCLSGVRAVLGKQIPPKRRGAVSAPTGAGSGRATSVATNTSQSAGAGGQITRCSSSGVVSKACRLSNRSSVFPSSTSASPVLLAERWNRRTPAEWPRP